MGLMKAALAPAFGIMADQWKDYFYCDTMPDNILVRKGRKRTFRNQNRDSDNSISTGAIIAVSDGQCMIIVDHGRIVELCAEVGEFIYDSSIEPSIFSSNLSASMKETVNDMWNHVSFECKDDNTQRIYYFNTKNFQ